MRLCALNPGVSVDQVRAATGFLFPVAREIKRNDPPSAEELKTLREQVDPEKVFLS